MSKLFIYLCMVVAVVGMTSLVGMADEGSHKSSPNSHHQELQAVVVEKGGARVRAELNEAGRIIDVHPEKSGAH